MTSHASRVHQLAQERRSPDSLARVTPIRKSKQNAGCARSAISSNTYRFSQQWHSRCKLSTDNWCTPKWLADALGRLLTTLAWVGAKHAWADYRLTDTGRAEVVEIRAGNYATRRVA